MGVTVVTQTRVAEGGAERFGQFQAAISAAITGRAGFIEQSVLPPKPPAQTDWVILQRFTTAEDATAWLQSPVRQGLVADIQPVLAGVDDVHLLRDEAAGVLPAPVSVVFTTKLKPGAGPAFRIWEQRMAAAQARSPGFQGYRFQGPIPGVQEDTMAILRFDTEASLQRWMDSPERARLLLEAAPLVEAVSSRVVHAGFSQWFPVETGQQAPAWKQNMIVLLLLYPVVFLFGLAVQTPLLMNRGGMPFWLALFISNAVSVLVLNELVPRVTGLFGWWLRPASGMVAMTGVVLVLGLYGVWMGLFSMM